MSEPSILPSRLRIGFTLSPSDAAAFEAASFEYAVHPNDLARQIIQAAVRDQLIGEIMPTVALAVSSRGWEQMGAPLNRALAKIAAGKPLEGES